MTAPHAPYPPGSAGTASAGYLVPSPRRPERETSDPDEPGRRRVVPLSYVSAADLLDPEPLAPYEPRLPERRSSLRGRAVPARPAAAGAATRTTHTEGETDRAQ